VGTAAFRESQEAGTNSAVIEHCPAAASADPAPAVGSSSQQDVPASDSGSGSGSTDVGDGGDLDELADVTISCSELEKLLESLENEQAVADSSFEPLDGRGVDPKSLTCMQLLTTPWDGFDILGAALDPNSQLQEAQFQPQVHAGVGRTNEVDYDLDSVIDF
jgi:hypothetical protein